MPAIPPWPSCCSEPSNTRTACCDGRRFASHRACGANLWRGPWRTWPRRTRTLARDGRRVASWKSAERHPERQDPSGGLGRGGGAFPGLRRGKPGSCRVPERRRSDRPTLRTTAARREPESKRPPTRGATSGNSCEDRATVRPRTILFGAFADRALAAACVVGDSPLSPAFGWKLPGPGRFPRADARDLAPRRTPADRPASGRDPAGSPSPADSPTRTWVSRRSVRSAEAEPLPPAPGPGYEVNLDRCEVEFKHVLGGRERASSDGGHAPARSDRRGPRRGGALAAPAARR